MDPLAEPLQKPPGNDSSSQTSLPGLPHSTDRKLDLKWTTLKEKYHLDGGYLHRHDKARRRRCVVGQMDHIWILSSANVARHRFTDLAYAYWPIWNPATPHEVFASWLDVIGRRTSSDIESVWKGQSDAIDGWYEKTCNPAVQKELDTLIQEWTKKLAPRSWPILNAVPPIPRLGLPPSSHSLQEGGHSVPDF